MRRGTLLGFPYVVHPTWLVIFALLIVSLVTSVSAPGLDRLAGPLSLGVGAIVVVLFIGSMLAHELAHAVIARSRGAPDADIRLLTPGGAGDGLPGDDRAVPPATELLVASAGPLLSVGIGGAALLVFALLPAGTAETTLMVAWTAWWLGLANLVLAGFHLIPALPLDGGHIVRAVASAVTHDRDRATRAAGVVGRLFGYGLIGAGLVSVAFSAELLLGIWLVLLGWFSGRLARTSVERQRITDLAAGLTVADVLDPDVPSVPGSLIIDTLLAQDQHSRGSIYTIVEDGRVAGILETGSLRRAIWGRQGERRVAEVATPIGEVRGLAPTASLLAAVDRFEAERSEELPVVEAGDVPSLVGIVRRAAILERLRARQALAGGRAGTTGSPDADSAGTTGSAGDRPDR